MLTLECGNAGPSPVGPATKRFSAYQASAAASVRLRSEGHTVRRSCGPREFAAYVTGTLASEARVAGDAGREAVLRNLPTELGIAA
jgi:hypothetical protein